MHEMLAATSCHLACLQETKLSNIDGALAGFLGGHRLSTFAYKPAVGTKGGILLLWNDAALDVQNIVIRRFSITATVTLRDCLSTFLLTTVYGPSRDNHKRDFLCELRRFKPDDDQNWLVLGDFNLIYRAIDKNNTNLNLRRMRQFRATLNRCQLKEIHLQNHKYTWSNERR
jgi:exonuclease III